MKILHDDNVASADERSVVTIGVFDGLHRGHQAIIDLVVELAKAHDAAPTVVTFDPAPAEVLAPDRAPHLLGTVEQRLEGLAALGVEQVRVLTFNEQLASETARAFIDRVLVDELRARAVVVGEDFHFGHDREGTVAMLREVGAERGFDVVSPSPFGEPQRWSSTSVRRALESGDLDTARAVLGRPFTLRAEVVHGDERGAALGFPTANLASAANQQLPKEGVYAGVARVEGTWWPAAISVGTRPQFYQHGDVLVEVHLLDYVGNLYGRTIDVAFLAWLREQLTFASEDELVACINGDVAETRRLVEAVWGPDEELLGLMFGQRR